MNKKFLSNVTKDIDVIMLTEFGSHLYGTDTPTSDRDYKGIFMPTEKQILLNKIPKSIRFDTNKTNKKNSTEDIDCELYSLHYFFDLAKKGETVSIDMLHSSPIISSKIWKDIFAFRSNFYCTNMKSLMGYAKHQAAKYGIKGSRLYSAEKLKTFLNEFDSNLKMKFVWDKLPIDENIKFINDNQKIKSLNFCGKILQDSIKISYALDIIETFINNYGARAKLAKENKGVDFKALHHALRAAFQLEEIFLTGDLKFPLKTAPFLKCIKQERYSYNFVIEYLEDKIDKVEKLSLESNLPSEINTEKIDDFLFNIIKEEI